MASHGLDLQSFKEPLGRTHWLYLFTGFVCLEQQGQVKAALLLARCLDEDGGYTLKSSQRCSRYGAFQTMFG